MNECLMKKHPTDIAHFKATDLTDFVKRFIISHQSCRPEGPFPKDPTQNNRHFSASYYSILESCGRTIQRLWLYYSPILNVAWCEPCWLFSSTANDNWRSGIRD